MYPQDFKQVTIKEQEEPSILEINSVISEIQKDRDDGINVVEMGNVIIVQIKNQERNKIIVAKNFVELNQGGYNSEEQGQA